jgi:hypothetical protein
VKPGRQAGFCISGDVGTHKVHVAAVRRRGIRTRYDLEFRRVG